MVDQPSNSVPQMNDIEVGSAISNPSCLLLHSNSSTALCVLRGFHFVLSPSTFSFSLAAACAAASLAVSTRNGEQET